MIKAVILIGGPFKGTRFRPLSFDLPKPLFPVAGFPVIYHHMEACSKIPGLSEILLIGFYQPSDVLKRVMEQAREAFNLQIRYLQEYTALGTAGCIFHFRDQILAGNPDLIFVLNSDTCGDFPLLEMLKFQRERALEAYGIILGTEATRQQSLSYGCIVENKKTHEIIHYVENPETYISSTINCGIYLFSPQIFHVLGVLCRKNLEDSHSSGSLTSRTERIRLEKDIFVPMAETGKLFVYKTTKFWSQIKSAGAAVYANRHYLEMYHRTQPDHLARNGEDTAQILGDVFIHPTAQIHPTAVLGPNVSIASGVCVEEGVRIKESIVLEGAVLKAHCCVLYSIVGWNSSVGVWSRVEGIPNDPNPDKPFGRLEVQDLTSEDGRLNPSITVIGCNVQIPAEVMVLSSIILPHKDLSGSYKYQIIL